MTRQCTFKAKIREPTILKTKFGENASLKATLGNVTVVSSDVEYYDGEYTVTPKPHEAQVLSTQNKLMKNNLTVLKIPYFETSNENGTTVIIG